MGDILCHPIVRWRRMRADRLVSIILMLQNRGPRTCAGLADELEVSRRTILRDLDALSTAGVPVIAEGGHGGGVRLDESYRAGLTGLGEGELRALLIGADAALARDPVANQDIADILSCICNMPETEEESEVPGVFSPTSGRQVSQDRFWLYFRRASLARARLEARSAGTWSDDRHWGNPLRVWPKHDSGQARGAEQNAQSNRERDDLLSVGDCGQDRPLGISLGHALGVEAEFGESYKQESEPNDGEEKPYPALEVARRKLQNALARSRGKGLLEG
jgi:hypothetical protein